MSPDQAKELANEANTRLQEAYEKILPQWKTIFAKEAGLNRRLSIPCFLDVQPEYFAAPTRVVFVGQETLRVSSVADGDAFGKIEVILEGD